MGKVVGIVSGKGGVGKTTLALNLGLAMHRMGEKIIVIDCDIKNPNIGVYIGMHRPYTTINDILNGNSNIIDAISTHSSGIKVILASLVFTPLDYDLTRLRTLFNNLEDYNIILDFGPGLDKDTMSFLEVCDEVLIVTNPNMPSVVSTLRMIDIIKARGKNVMGIVVNRIGPSYEITREELEIVCAGTPIIGLIPEDEDVRRSAMMKTPVVDSKPYSGAALRFSELAARILERGYRRPRFASLKHFVGWKPSGTV